MRKFMQIELLLNEIIYINKARFISYLLFVQCYFVFVITFVVHNIIKELSVVLLRNHAIKLSRKYQVKDKSNSLTNFLISFACNSKPMTYLDSFCQFYCT